MKVIPPSPGEPSRLAALERYEILDSPSDDILDGITRAVADMCETPIALVSLVDSGRQWFKSSVGLKVTETGRDIAFCTHAMEQPDALMEIEDCSKDSRFVDNPLVTGEPYIRFYAGKPLVTPDGYALGTLCVIDDKPRKLNRYQRNGLSRLASVVMDLFNERYYSRLKSIDYVVNHSLLHSVLITDPYQEDNPITYANKALENLTGYTNEEVIGRNCRFLQGPDTDPAAVAKIRNAIDKRESVTVTLKNYRKDGTAFWNELTVSPVNDAAGETVNFVAIQHEVIDS